MKVCEGQRLGALIVLIASLAVYGGRLLHDRHPLSESPLPWGDQGSGRIAIEVTGNRGAEGIYFLPEATAFTQLSKITSNQVTIAQAGSDDTRFSSGSAISVSTEGGRLKIMDMSAVKRLALGLPIDLNRATEEELSLVPGIGEKMAAHIVRLRQLRGKFGGLADLTAVPGIKERKLRDLEKYLTVVSMP
jgi:DNA uptake protein ComE-like DNA-binding protein